MFIDVMWTCCEWAEEYNLLNTQAKFSFGTEVTVEANNKKTISGYCSAHFSTITTDKSNE